MKREWKYIVLFILLALGLSFPVQQGYLNDIFQSVTTKKLWFVSMYKMLKEIRLVHLIAERRLTKERKLKSTGSNNVYWSYHEGYDSYTRPFAVSI
jgi:hypothetical protein